MRLVLLACALVWTGAFTYAAEPVNNLPHLQIDVQKKQVRVECEALNIEAPLEFFLVVSGTQDHETVLRSLVRPSHLHQAMLMVGLTPGEPVHYSDAAKKWFPPKGPPIHMYCEYEKDGKTVRTPAYRWIRNIKTKKSPPAFTWVFTGSRVMEDGKYAADVTGYLVSIVNFDLTVIDIPALASNANETLEWEVNRDVVPKSGTKVWLVIEPAGADEAATTQPAEGAIGEIDLTVVKIDSAGKVLLNDRPVTNDDLKTQLKKMNADHPLNLRVAAAQDAKYELIAQVLTAAHDAGVKNVSVAAGKPAASAEDVEIEKVKMDEAKVKALRQRWEKAVKPHADALKEAAQTHYEVINSLRREQQRLIDEADRVQRVIDQLEKDYQNMTTPRPGKEE